MPHSFLLSTQAAFRLTRRPTTARFVAVLVWLAAAPLAARAIAADGEARGGEASGGDPLHIRWPQYRLLELPSYAVASPWYDMIVPAELFGVSRLDLGDLRLFDAANREVHYALRTLRAQYSQEELKTTEFNRATVGDGATELTLDLGAEPAEHNEIEFKLAGEDFRRPALLEASNDNQEWRKLAEGKLFSFRSGGRELHDLRLAYPPSRFRYLRVRVERDPVVDRQPVEIASAIVRRRVELPGEFLSVDATVGPREPVRAGLGPGSAWIIDLGVDQAPCERIELEVSNDEFARDFVIEAGGPAASDRPFVQVAQGQWSRKAGESVQPLTAEFPEQQCARLRLIITDFSNSPLYVLSCRASGAARQIVFAREPSLRGPLRLYYGNPNAEPPHYDLERNLPARLDPAPERLEIGALQANPDYAPEPKPLTERWPWLVRLVLASAGLTLAAIIASLGRTAIANADEAQAGERGERG